MLRNLSVRNFALIQEISLEFQPGFTILVGETGAGKSIIMDALAAALGDKVSADVVSTGSRKAIVEATFDATNIQEVQSLLEKNELSWEAPETVVRREIRTTGTSRLFVNDIPTNAAVVRELAAFLIDFHGQHDTHGLLNANRHIALVDSCADYATLLNGMKGAWDSLVSARKRVTELEQVAAQSEDLRFKYERIVHQVFDVKPVDGEIELVSQQVRQFEGREQIIQAASLIRSYLTELDTSAHARLVHARESLAFLATFDSTLSSMVSELDSAITTCKETTSAVYELAKSDSFNPDEIEALRQRLVTLQRLVRQFGSIEEANAQARAAQDSLEQIRNLDTLLEEARQKERELAESAVAVAAKLTVQRGATALRLAARCTEVIRTMGMPNATVAIEVTERSMGANGADAVTILFSSHGGDDLRPLNKVASGGELSRFMVALKSTLTNEGSLGTLVFDEIDTGISGRVARRVGEVIASLSHHTQVLCITHLAQIASLASHIIRVEKQEDEHGVNVNAQIIGNDDSIVEIARLLSGDQITEAAIVGAKELMGR